MKKNNQNRVKFISYFEMELVLLILNLVHLTSSFKACQTEKDNNCIEATDMITLDENAKQQNCWVGDEILIRYTNSSDKNSYIGILNKNGIIIKYNGCVLKQIKYNEIKDNLEKLIFQKPIDFTLFIGIIIIISLVLFLIFKKKLILCWKFFYNFIKCKKYLMPTMMPVANQNVPQQIQMDKFQPQNLTPYQPTHVYPSIPQNNIQTADFYNRLYKPSAPTYDSTIFCCCKIDNGDGLCNKKICTCKKARITCLTRCHFGQNVCCKNDGHYELIK